MKCFLACVFGRKWRIKRVGEMVGEKGGGGLTSAKSCMRLLEEARA